MTKLKIALMLVALSAFSVMAFATITPVNSGPNDLNVYQQTTNAPCVIGNTSCSNGTFIDSEFSGTPGGTGNFTTYDLLSPGYVVGSGSGVVPTNTIPSSFIIAIDENIAKGAGNEFLVFFKTWYCTTAPTVSLPKNGAGGSTAVGPPSTGATVNGYGGCTLSADNSYVPGSPYMIPNLNNGNGFSDMILTGFSIPVGTHYVVFEASVSNDTDGMEQFFLVPIGTPVVPEPASMALLGSGLLSVAAWGRKRFFR